MPLRGYGAGWYDLCVFCADSLPAQSSRKPPPLPLLGNGVNSALTFFAWQRFETAKPMSVAYLLFERCCDDHISQLRAVNTSVSIVASLFLQTPRDHPAHHLRVRVPLPSGAITCVEPFS